MIVHSSKNPIILNEGFLNLKRNNIEKRTKYMALKIKNILNDESLNAPEDIKKLNYEVKIFNTYGLITIENLDKCCEITGDPHLIKKIIDSACSIALQDCKKFIGPTNMKMATSLEDNLKNYFVFIT